MIDFEKQMAAQDELIARRKKALVHKKENTGERAGILSERELRKLLKQAQRRRARLVRDRDRRAKERKSTTD